MENSGNYGLCSMNYWDKFEYCKLSVRFWELEIRRRISKIQSSPCVNEFLRQATIVGPQRTAEVVVYTGASLGENIFQYEQLDPLYSQHVLTEKACILWETMVPLMKVKSLFLPLFHYFQLRFRVSSLLRCFKSYGIWNILGMLRAFQYAIQQNKEY